MIRTLIIDKEPAVRTELQVLLSHNSRFMCIGCCGSIAEGLVLMEAIRPDLVLLAVELSDGNSFELLQQLKEIRFRIILITAYPDHALKAIKWGALDYLMNPMDEQELATALVKLPSGGPGTATQHGLHSKEHMETEPPKRLALRLQDCIETILVEDIIYCRSDSGYTTFHLTDGRKMMVSRTLKEFENLLKEPVFIRPHQSYLVSIAAIAPYHKEGMLQLKNGTKIPVATRRRERILDTLTGP